MAALTVWRFDTSADADRAADVLLDLAGGDGGLRVDAATVVWAEGKPRPRTRPMVAEPAGPEALGAGFWGLLFGLIFFVPLLGAAVGTATGAVSSALTDIGIDDGFMNRVRDQVTPGTSALFVLAADPVLEQVHEAFAGGPRSEVIRADLSAEEDAALRETFGA